jgi:predicted ester cyclase
MKNVLALIAVFLMITGCNNKSADNSSGNNSLRQQNLEAAHNITKAFETGDTSLIDHSVAADYIDHREYGDVKGIDSLKAMILSVHAHIKNMKVETSKELADDDYVMSWKKFTGTGDGQGNTLPGDFNVTGAQITRFKNGKAVEHWEALDMRDVSKMIQRLTADENNEVDSSAAQ